MHKLTAIISASIAGLLIIAASVQALLRDTPTPLPNLGGTAAVAGEGESGGPATPPADGSTAKLQDALRREIAMREQLGETVARLEKEIKELKSKIDGATPSPARATVAVESVDAAPERVRAEGKAPDDDERAQRAGIDPDTVTQIRQRFEQIEMDRLYLKDRAQREGWSGTARYSNEVAKIEERRSEVRHSLGEPGYDAYLYANGDPNRVSIRELLTGSPAGTAGLRVGDVVLRYDGKQVFTTRELQNATAAGRSGENVPVEIERDGQSMTLYVPRGPLGVYLDMQRRAP